MSRTRIVTLQDLEPDQVFIRNEDYEEEIHKLKDTAIAIKEELNRVKKERVRDNILIEKLKTALIDTHNRLKELEQSVEESKQQSIRVRTGGSSTNIFNEVNKLLVKELKISEKELNEMKNDADDVIKSLLN